MMNVDGDMIYKILSFILMSRVTINHDALDLTIQGPAPPLEGSPCSQTWSNLFSLDLTVLDMLKLVHYEAWTVGKWVVGIRLKSLFVKLNFIKM